MEANADVDFVASCSGSLDFLVAWVDQEEACAEDALLPSLIVVDNVDLVELIFSTNFISGLTLLPWMFSHLLVVPFQQELTFQIVS